jgi:hypothetical protein
MMCVLTAHLNVDLRKMPPLVQSFPAEHFAEARSVIKATFS